MAEQFDPNINEKLRGKSGSKSRSTKDRNGLLARLTKSMHAGSPKSSKRTTKYRDDSQIHQSSQAMGAAERERSSKSTTGKRTNDKSARQTGQRVSPPEKYPCLGPNDGRLSGQPALSPLHVWESASNIPQEPKHQETARYREEKHSAVSRSPTKNKSRVQPNSESLEGNQHQTTRHNDDHLQQSNYADSLLSETKSGKAKPNSERCTQSSRASPASKSPHDASGLSPDGSQFGLPSATSVKVSTSHYPRQTDELSTQARPQNAGKRPDECQQHLRKTTSSIKHQQQSTRYASQHSEQERLGLPSPSRSQHKRDDIRSGSEPDRSTTQKSRNVMGCCTVPRSPDSGDHHHNIGVRNVGSKEMQHSQSLGVGLSGRGRTSASSLSSQESGHLERSSANTTPKSSSSRREDQQNWTSSSPKYRENQRFHESIVAEGSSQRPTSGSNTPSHDEYSGKKRSHVRQLASSDDHTESNKEQRSNHGDVGDHMRGRSLPESAVKSAMPGAAQPESIKKTGIKGKRQRPDVPDMLGIISAKPMAPTSRTTRQENLQSQVILQATSSVSHSEEQQQNLKATPERSVDDWNSHNQRSVGATSSLAHRKDLQSQQSKVVTKVKPRHRATLERTTDEFENYNQRQAKPKSTTHSENIEFQATQRTEDRRKDTKPIAAGITDEWENYNQRQAEPKSAAHSENIEFQETQRAEDGRKDTKPIAAGIPDEWENYNQRQAEPKSAAHSESMEFQATQMATDKRADVSTPGKSHNLRSTKSKSTPSSATMEFQSSQMATDRRGDVSTPGSTTDQWENYNLRSTHTKASESVEFQEERSVIEPKKEPGLDEDLEDMENFNLRPVAPQPEEEEFQEEQWADDRMEMPEDSHPKTTDFAPSSHDLRKKEDWERQAAERVKQGVKQAERDLNMLGEDVARERRKHGRHLANPVEDSTYSMAADMPGTTTIQDTTVFTTLLKESVYEAAIFPGIPGSQLRTILTSKLEQYLKKDPRKLPRHLSRRRLQVALDHLAFCTDHDLEVMADGLIIEENISTVTYKMMKRMIGEEPGEE